MSWRFLIMCVNLSRKLEKSSRFLLTFQNEGEEDSFTGFTSKEIDGNNLLT